MKNLNQQTGNYRTKDSIENFKFRISLRKLYSTIEIPKFEKFQSNLNEQNPTVDFEEVVTIQWQEKLFSKTEKSYYSQKENCKNEHEKKYHQMIKELDSHDSKGIIFTYIDEDAYESPDNFGPQSVRITPLRTKIEKHEKPSNNGKNRKSIFIDADDTEIATRYDLGDKFVKMSVLADLDPTTLLATIFYRESDGLFRIFPDFTSDHNCYMLEIDQNSKQNYIYSIENLSAISSDETTLRFQKEKLDKVQDETCQLMKKLNLTEEIDFEHPKFCRIVILLEIIDGNCFEYDNLHIQFAIKLPKFCRLIEGELHGSTHSTYKSRDVWNFGYCHSLVVDIDDEFMLSQKHVDTISISFEVISIDSTWDIERREGFASMKIPLEKSKPLGDVELKCFRDLQGNSRFMDFLERFFLGGIHKKITEFDDCSANLYGNQTISSGNLRVRLHKITQTKQSKRSFAKMKAIDEIISSYHQLSKSTKLLTE